MRWRRVKSLRKTHTDTTPAILTLTKKEFAFLHTTQRHMTKIFFDGQKIH